MDTSKTEPGEGSSRKEGEASPQNKSRGDETQKAMRVERRPGHKSKATINGILTHLISCSFFMPSLPLQQCLGDLKQHVNKLPPDTPKLDSWPVRKVFC